MARTGLVWPLWLNLGVAPPAPRGALALAPRTYAAPQFTLGDPFARVRRNTTPLLLPTYVLPSTQLVPGFAFLSPQTNSMSPNPYEAQS